MITSYITLHHIVVMLHHTIVYYTILVIILHHTSVILHRIVIKLHHTVVMLQHSYTVVVTQSIRDKLLLDSQYHLLVIILMPIDQR